jgi:predicted TIM-barrel fold metal-dependent hydrolase
MRTTLAEIGSMEIIDCHAHIFPPLWEACGLPDAATHLLHQQRALHTHGNQPVRRLRDHAIVGERHLWQADDPSEAGRAQGLNFRVSRYGRFEWEHEGEGYYVQFLPPHLQEMTSPPEFMVTQMDYAGIRACVLQNDHIYGNLSGYFARAIARFPGRFIGLANVEEAFAHRDDQIAALVAAVEKEGMRGLYFTNAAFFRNGYQAYFDDPRYAPFWDQVRRLELPVFWVFLARSPLGDFAHEMGCFRRWLERYPDIPSVMVHGMPTVLWADDQDVVRFPAYMTEIMEQYPVYSEILYPIMWGGKMNFPFARAQSHIRQVFDRFGPDRLLWGSDMPNVERYCTYRQTLTYVLDYCAFLGEEDRRKIFRDNTLSLFDLEGVP